MSRVLLVICALSCALLIASRICAADYPTDDRVIRVTSLATVKSTREALIEYIWGSSWTAVAAKQPNSVQHNFRPQADDALPADVDNLRSVDRLDVNTSEPTKAGNTEVIASTAFILYPAKGNLHRAVIVHHGHGCEMVDVGSQPLHLELAIRALVSAGYTVAAMRMPLFQNPSHCGVTRVHDKLFDPPLREGSALKFFMEPIARTVNYLVKQDPDLKELDMIGLSGGGWTTTVYAAIDPRITKSFPVAGTLPLYLRRPNYNHDLEQYFSPFYRVAGYKDLYVLGAAGKGRLQIQILNRYDDCCFGERQHAVSGPSYTQAIRNYERDVCRTLEHMHTGRFAVHLDESARYHQISEEAFQNVILPMLAASRDKSR
jgi:pimeloyl-ACP methyl ester carboxylesterase